MIIRIIRIIFNISASYFYKFSFHYFKKLFNDESDLQGKVFHLDIESL
jgi:hypothetical protein